MGNSRQNFGQIWRNGFLAIFAVALISNSNALAKSLTEKQIKDLPCDFSNVARNSDGKLNLALIVGINDYARIAPDLRGAVNDAGKFYNLIVEDKKQAFPKSNVCVLTDHEASYDGFYAAFNSLIDRARDEVGPADNVIFYFAGHGSQLRDNNGDESDFEDETLVLYDSNARIPNGRNLLLNGRNMRKWPHLRDDALNSLLARLNKKTPNFVVVLDSCNSGTATRSLDSGYTARYAPRNKFVDGAEENDENMSRGDGDGGFDTVGQNFPNAVILTAARASEFAYERAGAGLFTDALVQTLTNASDEQLTYDQLTARIRNDLGARAKQRPTVSGKSNQLVFTDEIPLTPAYGWEVNRSVGNKKGNKVRMTGAPTPGMGIGAEYLILPGAASSGAGGHLNLAKARITINERAPSSNVATGTVSEVYKSGVRIEAGDIAVLRKPSLEARKLHVKIRGAEQPGGVANATELAESIKLAIQDDLDFRDGDLIEFVDTGFEFEIAALGKDRLQIIDPQGGVRNTPANAVEAGEALINHLGRLTLLNDWSITGGTMTPNETLQVSLVPYNPGERINACRNEHTPRNWAAAAPNEEQIIPLCGAYTIRVKLHKDAKFNVVIGGSVLAADGNRYHFPEDRKRIELAPGQETKIADLPSIYQATPEGLGVEEHVFVLGLPAQYIGGDNETSFSIPWLLLSTEITKTRGNVRLSAGESRDEYGTYTIVPIRVEANARFAKSTGEDEIVTNEEAKSREYTLKGFNIAPYLPDDQNSALYRVLDAANSLTNITDAGDGYPYTQHGWCKGTDAANLDHGIDCSRSIWFAFSRASGGGVPYNRYAMSKPDSAMCTPYDPKKNGYLITRDMAKTGESSLMRDQFQQCDTSQEGGASKFQLGDILVYRDPFREDGHTVMVIDPKKRIAWGSHGWDGSPNFEGTAEGFPVAADTGVEYQKIKIKKDWARWDRSTMELEACWRHKMFIEEAKAPKGRPGIKHLCQLVMKPGWQFIESSVCSPFFDDEGEQL